MIACSCILVVTSVFCFVPVTIESVGAMAPDVIFKEAVKIIKDKCVSLLEELNATK